MEINKIYNMDCLEGMKDIPNGSIDMILCDLPYGSTHCKWDIIIDFKSLWQQYNRIIKNDGAIVLFGNEPFSSHLRISNIEKYKYDWIYKKRPVNYLNAKRQPLRDTENIMVFNTKRYNPQGLIQQNKINKRSSPARVNTDHPLSNESFFTNYPRQIIECIGERGLHPTQKPVKLLEYLIKTYSNEGEIVLDNCIGSGSTAIACINTNRNFIGYELEKEYYDIACKRIEEHKHVLL